VAVFNERLVSRFDPLGDSSHDVVVTHRHQTGGAATTVTTTSEELACSIRWFVAYVSDRSSSFWMYAVTPQRPYPPRT
jgi:hypothetical protein